MKHLVPLLLTLALWSNTGCQSDTALAVPPPAGLTRTVASTAVPPTSSPVSTAHTVAALPSTPTAIPTATSVPATATPTITPTATPTLTPTPIGPCSQRTPSDDLLTVVTQQYGLSRAYEPGDLVPLAGYLPVTVTLGYPTEVRQVIVEPLVQMINDMQTAGLQPFVISGYRSYSAQAIAWDKWRQQYPDHVGIISAPPGYSEHQLGTTIDFGSPELADIVGEEDIEFHTYFYKTSEGIWLAENAHRYGFTLSYPRQAFELTGFYYEPWHYRYVGEELATQLKAMDMFLTEYLFIIQTAPCIP